MPELSEAERARQDETGLTDERLRAIRHGYYAAISEVDHHVGRILERLNELGRAENTVVVFLSDHGEWLGDHLRVAKGYPADDPVSRVPLIVRWPVGITAPGRRHEGIVEAVDVLPTLLDCAAIPVPRTAQGHSLLPVLHNQATDRPQVGITEHADWRSVRSPDYHYLVHADGTESLWDLGADPNEHDDVAGRPEHSDSLQEHRLLLIQHSIRNQRQLTRTWPY